MNHLIIAVLNSRKFITINLGAGMDKQKIATPQAFNKNTYKLLTSNVNALRRLLKCDKASRPFLEAKQLLFS
jgi:hypothetical protein